MCVKIQDGPYELHIIKNFEMEWNFSFKFICVHCVCRVYARVVVFCKFNDNGTNTDIWWDEFF